MWSSLPLWVHRPIHRCVRGVQNTYELVNLGSREISLINKLHIFQCICKIFCVEPSYTHTFKDTILIQYRKCKSSQMICELIWVFETTPRTRLCHHSVVIEQLLERVQLSAHLGLIIVANLVPHQLTIDTLTDHRSKNNQYMWQVEMH